VASQATQSAKTLTIEDPQIVNGLQTSTEIFNHFSVSGDSADQRTVLVRVVVPTKAESRDRIIKATNSQTYIPPASLRATDKVQRDIEQFLQPFGLFYDRRKNFHKNEGKPVDKIISIPAMAQAVMAIALARPDTARARPSSLLKSDEDYGSLFAETIPLALYRNCISIVRRCEDRLRVASHLSPKDRNNCRYYVALQVAIALTGKKPPIIKALAELDLKAVTDELVDGCISKVQKIYVSLGGTDQTAKGSEMLKALLT
jgi:hypothetical protein